MLQTEAGCHLKRVTQEKEVSGQQRQIYRETLHYVTCLIYPPTGDDVLSGSIALSEYSPK